MPILATLAAGDSSTGSAINDADWVTERSGATRGERKPDIDRTSVRSLRFLRRLWLPRTLCGLTVWAAEAFQGILHKVATTSHASAADEITSLV